MPPALTLSAVLKHKPCSSAMQRLANLPKRGKDVAGFEMAVAA